MRSCMLLRYSGEVGAIDLNRLGGSGEPPLPIAHATSARFSVTTD
jgi:hypothetical protein